MIFKKREYNYNRTSINNLSLNETNSKTISLSSTKESHYFSIIQDIYKYAYEDYFPIILTFKTKELFQNEIEKKVSNYLHNNFNEQELITPFIKITIKKKREELNNKINKDYSFLNESLNNLTKFPKKMKYLTHFRKHCNKTENIASHLCDDGKIGKLIEIKSKFAYNKNIIDYVICEKCNFCYEKNFIKIYCKDCEKNYYSEILKDNVDINCLPATWDNYHCGTRMKETMKCLKCKSTLYINLNNNSLICKNKKCNFLIKPENIIWKCYSCGCEFKSGAKIYNPLDYEIVNKAINRAILYKNKAKPLFLPCCKGEINDKIIFYHKQDCKGQLYKSNLNYKDIVVCEKCHALNGFEKFLWLCPLCNQTFRIKEKKISYDYSNSSSFPTNLMNLKHLIKTKTNPPSNKRKNIANKATYEFYRNLRDNLTNNTSNNKTGIKTPESIASKYLNYEFKAKNNISCERGRNYSNINEDISLLNKDNKTSINVNNEKEDTIIKVSKSIEEKTDYDFYKRRRRKRQTLQEILNSRRNTPNIDRNNNDICYEKEIIKNNTIDSVIKNYQNKRTRYGFMGKNLFNNEIKTNAINIIDNNNDKDNDNKNNNDTNNNNINDDEKNSANNCGFKRIFYKKNENVDDKNIIKKYNIRNYLKEISN